MLFSSHSLSLKFLRKSVFQRGSRSSFQTISAHGCVSCMPLLCFLGMIPDAHTEPLQVSPSGKVTEGRDGGSKALPAVRHSCFIAFGQYINISGHLHEAIWCPVM